jgi:DNA primase
MNGFNIVGDLSRDVMIVVESELDALALHFAAPDLLVAVSAGSNTTNPDNVTDYLAKKKPSLWICHDNDEAGLAMLSKWEKLYSHCVPRPVPVGKDVGEAIQGGFELREWLLKHFKQ